MRELSLHLLDLARNSLEAGATQVTIELAEDPEEDTLRVTVQDNGRGMDTETVRRATDPFYTSRRTRRQGLGLPLFQAMCERCEGSLQIQSAPGEGTTVRGQMRLSHLDRPPLGDMGGVMQALACEAERVRVVYRHRAPGGLFELDTAALQRKLGEVRVTDPTVLHWIGEHVQAGLRELGSRA